MEMKPGSLLDRWVTFRAKWIGGHLLSSVRLLFSSYLLSAETMVGWQIEPENKVSYFKTNQGDKCEKQRDIAKRKVVILRAEKGEKMCDFYTSIHREERNFLFFPAHPATPHSPPPPGRNTAKTFSFYDHMAR